MIYVTFILVEKKGGAFVERKQTNRKDTHKIKKTWQQRQQLSSTLLEKQESTSKKEKKKKRRKKMAAEESGALLETKQQSIELKRELKRVVKAIVEEDDYTLEATDEAMQALRALKDCELKPLNSQLLLLHHSGRQFLNVVPPRELRCPLSGQLMKDPVVLASGQTYDRQFIEKWLKDGHRTCPQTEKFLSHTVLTPNHLVREMILQLCREHGIELPCPAQDDNKEMIIDADRQHLNSLLEKISSSSLSDQKEAANELQLLTKQMPYFRVLFGEIKDAISLLLNPLSTGSPDTHPDLQENLIAIVLNLSIHDSNKKLMAENPIAIPLLIESLTSGNVETRRNAAAVLFTLSALDSNKYLFGKFGALKPLINLLEEGHPLVMRDAASAIFNLCIVVENRGNAVSEGAVGVIMKKIMDRVLIDELLAILVMLSSHQKAIEEMAELGAVSCLLSIMKENTSENTKENCIAILFTMCFNDRTKLTEIKREEDANRTISRLTQNGTTRARRKANGILERLDRYASITHTA